MTIKSVEDIAGVIPDATIEKLVKAMQQKSKGLVYEAVSKVVTDIVADGWSATQLVTQVCCHPFSDTSTGQKSNYITAIPIHRLQRVYS